MAPFVLRGDWLTTKEVAELLRVHPKHVYRLLRRGLPARRVGGHWRFSPAEVREWMARGQPLRGGEDRNKKKQSATSAAAPALIATNADLTIETLVSEVNREGPTVGLAPADTVTALDWLAAGSVVAVGVLGECIAPPGASLARIHVAYQQFGLAAPPGDAPPALEQLAKRGQRLASMTEGSDVRSQLDGVLRRESLDPRRIHANATIADSYEGVVSALLCGRATLGVVTAAWAQRCALPFSPIGSRPLGLVTKSDALGHPALIKCWHTLRGVGFADAVAELGGLELSDRGQIQYLVGEIAPFQAAEPGEAAPRTRASWVLLLRARGIDASEPLLELVEELRARGLSVGGFVQRPRRRKGEVMAYELRRLMGDGQVALARRKRSPAAGTKLAARSFQFEPGAFAEALGWLRRDGQQASVLIIDGVGKLEARGGGHHDALVWALRQRGPKVVVAVVRRDQSAIISKRFNLASRQLAVIEADAPPTARARLAEAIAAAAAPRA